VVENRVLRRIFGPKREEVAGGWRALHSDELHNSYASLYITRVMTSGRMRWARNVASMVEMRNTLFWLEGKRPLERPRRRWGCSIRMGLREVGWEGVNWIHLSEDRDQWRTLVNTVMNL
jgi:hypothetical protein